MWKYREDRAHLFDFHALFSYYARVILAGFSRQMFFNIIFASLLLRSLKDIPVWGEEEDESKVKSQKSKVGILLFTLHSSLFTFSSSRYANNLRLKL